jgi:hypothetical protein
VKLLLVVKYRVRLLLKTYHCFNNADMILKKGIRKQLQRRNRVNAIQPNGIFFWAGLWFELRALHLLDRYSIS